MNRKELDRLSRLRESANDSARNFRTVYVSYLIIALYILSIVIFREEELLFRNGSLQIAIVNFSVPIRSFFIVSPLILLALHFNLLIQAIFLSRKVYQYASAIPTIHLLQLLPSSNGEKMEMRDLLFPAPLAHIITGGDSDRTRQNLLLAVVLFSIIFLPPIILILIGTQFLAYQSKFITIGQFMFVAIDVGILWWLWPRIAAPDKKWIQWFQSLSPIIIVLTTLLTTLLTIFILISINLYDMREFPNRIKPAIPSPHVMSIAKQSSSLHDDSDRAGPDDRERTSSLSTWILNTINTIHISNTKYEFEDRELVQERPPPEILSAYLDTCREKRCDETVINSGTPVWCRYARPLDLEERVFRDAELSGAILCAVDFERAILNDAELLGAKFYGANFLNAELHGAVLDEAELHGADLFEAELHGADLYNAELHGADLRDAKLYAAYLFEADLRGADLREADLYGADLSEADLRGADLRKAKLYRANLTNADLRGADLREANLYGTKLIGVNLDHADLRKVDFSEPNFDELYMQTTKPIGTLKTLNQILKRIKNAEDHKILNHETLSALPSKKYSINYLHDFPYFCAYPEEKSIGDKYREKLAIYLVYGLACEDGSSGYVAKAIARRALADRLLGPQLAKNLLNAKCPAVANMLPEKLRADLKEITGGLGSTIGYGIPDFRVSSTSRRGAEACGDTTCSPCRHGAAKPQMTVK